MEKLFKIQNEIGTLVKNQDNPYFKSKYFDVNQIIEHLKPLLEKYNLVVLQPLSHVEGKIALETIVHDVESKKDIVISRTPLPEAPDAQKYGSAITYFRRYALQSLFLLQAEDDDGNKASHKPEKKQTPEEHAKKSELEYANDENPF